MCDPLMRAFLQVSGQAQAEDFAWIVRVVLFASEVDGPAYLASLTRQALDLHGSQLSLYTLEALL